MSIELKEPSILLKKALEALEHGEKEKAKALALQAAGLMPASEIPWLILAAVAEPEERQACIDRALEINPVSRRAKAAREWALERLAPPPTAIMPVLKTEPGKERMPFAPSMGGCEGEASQEISPPKRRENNFARTPGRMVLLTLSGIIVLTCVAVVVLFWDSLVQMFSGVLAPGGCQGVLEVGSTTFEIKTVEYRVGGLIQTPAGQLEAYWVNGSRIHPVFVFNEKIEIQAVSASSGAASLAIVKWPDCSAERYRLFEPVPGILDRHIIEDQSPGKVSLFIPVGTTLDGVLIHGERPAEGSAGLEPSNPLRTKAEISVMKIAAPGDRSRLIIRVSIHNSGQTPLTLTEEDILLVPEGAAPEALLDSIPTLPADIPPGGSEDFAFTFATPSIPWAILRVFEVGFLLDGY